MGEFIEYNYYYSHYLSVLTQVGMWVYGDSTPDMATEFGYKK